MNIELPSEEEMMKWIQDTYSHLNPDVKPFFLMGINDLYVKLGGNQLIEFK